MVQLKSYMLILHYCAAAATSVSILRERLDLWTFVGPVTKCPPLLGTEQEMEEEGKSQRKRKNGDGAKNRERTIEFSCPLTTKLTRKYWYELRHVKKLLF